MREATDIPEWLSATDITKEAQIFKDYLFILAWFSVRLPLFSYDLKTIFVFWSKFAIYFNKNKFGKIDICA